MSMKALLAGISLPVFLLTSGVTTHGVQSATPANCVQLGNFHDYACAYHEPGTGGGLYLDDVLFVNWYYWHPSPGDMVVEETYVKAGAPFFINPFHRSIHFSTTAQISDSTWLINFPQNPQPPTECDFQGVQQACTKVEQQSAMDFQHAIVTDNPGHSF